MVANRKSALARAVDRWRKHALDINHNPKAPLSQRRLAWRFLKQHGATA